MDHRAVALSAGLTATVMLAVIASPVQAEARPTVHVRPQFGPAGTRVRVTGAGFPSGGPSCQYVTITFTDSAGTRTALGSKAPDPGGTFGARRDIPATAAVGMGAIRVTQWGYHPRLHSCRPMAGGARAPFEVTASATPQFPAPTLRVRPHKGPGGTGVRIRGYGFAGHTPPMCLGVFVIFTDADGVTTSIGSRAVALDGTFRMKRTVPAGAALGSGSFSATQRPIPQGRHCVGTASAAAAFEVTALEGRLAAAR